jgi:elongation factor Ts
MEISAAQVKELREATGSGMMECKKALAESNGDVKRAIEILRTKGIAAAQKRVGRVAKEGLVASYIHPGDRLGVLVEVNCETDFVARTDDFRAFVKEIGMQVAGASPLVIERSELKPEDLEKEREIYRAQARNEGKPDKIIEKIVEGKLEKYYGQVCLMEQPHIKDPQKTVKTLLDEAISKLGENIVIRRFARFRLGE